MEELLTVKKVAEILGFSRQEIYKMVAKKKIPHTRISKRGIRFRIEDFEEWLQSKTIPSDSSLRYTSRNHTKTN